MDFYSACIQGVNAVRDRAPIKTGNLRYNGVQYESPNPDKFIIYVDYYDAKTRKGIAWYMPYTNEPWISDKWNGKKNPNEGWWQNAVDLAVNAIASALGGEIKR